MKLYIYDVETLEVVATFTGETNEECEAKAFQYLGVDEFGACYSKLGLFQSTPLCEEVAKLAG